jgi:hypothetical protein
VGRKNDLCCFGCFLFEIHGGSKIFPGCDEFGLWQRGTRPAAIVEILANFGRKIP